MSENDKLDKIWKTALKLIKSEVPTSSFQAWIKPAHLTSLDENKACLEVKNEFSRNLLIQNYYQSIAKALGKSLDRSVELIITVNRQLQTEEYTPSLSSLDERCQLENLPANSLPTITLGLSHNQTQNGLNPKFTFDNFIVGAHNQFCHAAALAIAEQSSQGAYNPFFIYGDVGLGKTHLMQAIGNYLLTRKPDSRVLYLSTEKFLNDLINHMRKSKMSDFRAKYRSLDLLMIDDIQFIEGKETTQEEFFHTFNALKDNGSQIVLTSDRPPKAIGRLEPRLCSRFEGGLLADVQAPTYETRLAIVARKAEELRMRVKPEVAHLIANSFAGSIRRLEGALLRLQAYTNFTGKSLTDELARQILQIDQTTSSVQMTSSKALGQAMVDSEKLIHNITSLLASELKVSPESILKRDNSPNAKNARQIAMFVARNKGISLTEIGQIFDGRGNSAILNSCKKVQNDMKSNQEMKKLIELLEKMLQKTNSASSAAAQAD